MGAQHQLIITLLKLTTSLIDLILLHVPENPRLIPRISQYIIDIKTTKYQESFGIAIFQCWSIHSHSWKNPQILHVSHIEPTWLYVDDLFIPRGPTSFPKPVSVAIEPLQSQRAWDDIHSQKTNCHINFWICIPLLSTFLQCNPDLRRNPVSKFS